MYLLDTNVISELRKAKTDKMHRRVNAWAKSVSATTLFLSSISILELEIGIFLLSAAIPCRGSSFAPGWTDMCCRLSKIAFSPWIRQSRSDAQRCMYQTRALIEMH